MEYFLEEFQGQGQKRQRKAQVDGREQPAGGVDRFSRKDSIIFTGNETR